MGPDEGGTVVGVQNREETYYGRGGPYKNYWTQIAVRMDKTGITRVCEVDDTTTTMIPIGTKVNLQYARRLY